MLSFGEGVMGRTVRSPAIPGEAVKGDMEVDKGGQLNHILSTRTVPQRMYRSQDRGFHDEPGRIIKLWPESIILLQDKLNLHFSQGESFLWLFMTRKDKRINRNETLTRIQIKRWGGHGFLASLASGLMRPVLRGGTLTSEQHQVRSLDFSISGLQVQGPTQSTLQAMYLLFKYLTNGTRFQRGVCKCEYWEMQRAFPHYPKVQFSSFKGYCLISPQDWDWPL